MRLAQPIVPRMVRPHLALVLSLAGCQAATFESREPPPTTGSPAPAGDSTAHSLWDRCYEHFTPTGTPQADLARLTQACGPTGGMRPTSPVAEGQQKASDPVDRYTFYVPKAGGCYRVYAVGDRNVTDLDLLLRGPSGDDVAADITHDGYPVLPPGSPLCFDTPGLYMLEVSVFSGAGRYALQVWGNPDGVGLPTP